MATQTAQKVVGKYQIKQVGPEEDRTLRFIGTDESEDRDGDIITADGWAFENYLKNPVFLWAHNYYSVPIGKCVAISKSPLSTGISFDIKFASIEELNSNPDIPSEESQLADTVYMAYKNGYLNAVSVGFIGLESAEREDQKEVPSWMRGRLFIRQEMLELSAVAIPSNPNALIQARSAKSVNPNQLKILETIFKAVPETAKEDDMKQEDVMKAISDATAPLLKEISDLKAFANQKGGMRLSAATMKSLQDLHDHIEKCPGMIKAIMQGDDSEPNGQSTTEDTPQTDVDGDVDAGDGKGIDLSKIDWKQYESETA
jgi:Escherichia/Staphylococcus phage prohead protease